MCGIFAYDIKRDAISESQRAILTYILAEHNDTRGSHSWGVIKLGKQPTITKGLGDMVPHAHSISVGNTLMAHTRFATHGDKTVDNAHPFKIGHITGMHNGVLYNHSSLNEAYKRTFPVDSMHLIAHLAEGKDFDDISGYGVVVWIDDNEPGKVYFCRLSGGEFSVAGLGTYENTRGIVCSSDEDHLEDALDKSGFKDDYFMYTIEQGTVYYISRGELYVTEKKLSFNKSYSGKMYSWQDWKDDDKDDKYVPFSYGKGFPDGEGDDDETLDFDNEKDLEAYFSDKDLMDPDVWNQYVMAHENLEALREAMARDMDSDSMSGLSDEEAEEWKEQERRYRYGG